MLILAFVFCLMTVEDNPECTAQLLVTQPKGNPILVTASIRDLNCSKADRLKPDKGNSQSNDCLSTDDFAYDPFARAWFLALFQLADCGLSDIERAAWVSGTSGQYAFHPWPRTGESNTIKADRPPDPDEWNVHTHPTRRKPWPSLRPHGQDQALAERMGKPIYTIHELGIWKYDPKTHQIIRLVDKSWRMGVDLQMVTLIVSKVRAMDERFKIQMRIAAAHSAYHKARTSGRLKRAASLRTIIEDCLEELQLVQMDIQTTHAQLENVLEAPTLENAVAGGPVITGE